jgi:hypothetical protein
MNQLKCKWGHEMDQQQEQFFEALTADKKLNDVSF